MLLPRVQICFQPSAESHNENSQLTEAARLKASLRALLLRPRPGIFLTRLCRSSPPRRTQGRMRRRRLRVVTLLAGSSCLALGCIGSYFYAGSIRRVFMAVLILGNAGLLLSVLPSERKLVQIVCLIMLAILLLGSLVQLGTVWLGPPSAACGELRPLPCALKHNRSRLPVLFSSLLVITVWLACSLRLGWLLARRRSGRHLLERVWHAVGVSVLAFSVQCAILWDWSGRAAEATAQGVAFNVTTHALLLVVTAISFLPRARARLTGWLASHGAANSSASRMAQLLGAGPADDTMRRSKELLRSIAFNAMRASDFTPDNVVADAHARTQPAHIGEIDAFVCRSQLPLAPAPACSGLSCSDCTCSPCCARAAAGRKALSCVPHAVIHRHRSHIRGKRTRRPNLRC